MILEMSDCGDCKLVLCTEFHHLHIRFHRPSRLGGGRTNPYIGSLLYDCNHASKELVYIRLFRLSPSWCRLEILVLYIFEAYCYVFGIPIMQALGSLKSSRIWDLLFSFQNFKWTNEMTNAFECACLTTRQIYSMMS